MTIEERAKEAIEKWWAQPGTVHHPTTEFIAATIREAIAEERERCAAICDRIDGGSDPAAHAARIIRGEEEENIRDAWSHPADIANRVSGGE